MIKEFIEKWEEDKDKLYEKYFKKSPENYAEIVKDIVLLINPKGKNNLPDSERITCSDGEPYQGTDLYIIRHHDDDTGFWYVYVDYGSCSGCDTFQCISVSDDSVKQKTNDYMTLAMHIVQSIKYIGDED